MATAACNPWRRKENSAFQLADLGPNEVWRVNTPRGTVTMTQAGRYGILVGSTDQPTVVTVLEGAAGDRRPGRFPADRGQSVGDGDRHPDAPGNG